MRSVSKQGITLSYPDLILSFPVAQQHVNLEAPSPWPDPVTELGHQPAVGPNIFPVDPLAVAGYHEEPPPKLQAAYRRDFPSAVDPPTSGAISIATQQDATPTAFQKHTRYSYVISKEREKVGNQLEDIQQDLTRANYKKKFHKLLWLEENEHINILDKR